jgi:hypothetical protein
MSRKGREEDRSFFQPFRQVYDKAIADAEIFAASADDKTAPIRADGSEFVIGFDCVVDKGDEEEDGRDCGEEGKEVLE